MLGLLFPLICICLANFALVSFAQPATELTFSLTTTTPGTSASSSGTDAPVQLRFFLQSLIWECEVEPEELETQYNCTATVVGFYCPDGILPGNLPVLTITNNDTDDVHIDSVRISGIEDFDVTAVSSTLFCLLDDAPWGSNISDYIVDPAECFRYGNFFTTTDICVNNGPGCSPSQQQLLWAAQSDTALAFMFPQERFPIDEMVNSTCAPTMAPTTVTDAPSVATINPSSSPSEASAPPSNMPTSSPSLATQSPSSSPSSPPSISPTGIPSGSPTISPTRIPSASPSAAPSKSPSASPSKAPSQPSASPTVPDSDSDSDDAGSSDDSGSSDESGSDSVDNAEAIMAAKLTDDAELYGDDETHYTYDITLSSSTKSWLAGFLLLLIALIGSMTCIWFHRCKVCYN